MLANRYAAKAKKKKKKIMRGQFTVYSQPWFKGDNEQSKILVN